MAGQIWTHARTCTLPKNVTAMSLFTASGLDKTLSPKNKTPDKQ